jgi:glutamine amidotransferase
MIVIVDYGLGNLGSIQNMLKKAGFPSIISDDPVEIEKADKIILPGVGAFDTGMRYLQEKGMLSILNHKAMVEKVPVLGLCLGAQLITSEARKVFFRVSAGWMVKLSDFISTMALRN